MKNLEGIGKLLIRIQTVLALSLLPKSIKSIYSLLVLKVIEINSKFLEKIIL
jgi:hypothetical protein